jgi:Flp pilus assembly protein CpaB
MKPRRLLAGIVTLALVLLGSVVHFLLKAKLAHCKAHVTVAVADGDLLVGATIQDQNVALMKRLLDGLPPGAFHTKKALIGREVILPIPKGEFILPYQLAEYKGREVPTLPRMFAVWVKAERIVPATALFQQDTRVDVLVSGRHTSRSETQTMSPVQNLAVLASRGERNAVGEPKIPMDVALLVSLEDAKKLALAGKYHLTLVARKRYTQN